MLLSYAEHERALGWPETGRNSSDTHLNSGNLSIASTCIESTLGASAKNSNYPFSLPNILWLTLPWQTNVELTESACADTATDTSDTVPSLPSTTGIPRSSILL